MEVELVAKCFRDHADKILGSKNDSSVKFRASSYERVASRLENDFKDTINLTDVEKIKVSDYMKERIKDVLNGKDLPKVKMDKTKSKSPKKTKSKSPKKTKIKDVEITSKKTDKITSRKTKSKSPKKTSDKLLKELTNFMGLGPAKAQALIDAGLLHINELHKKKFQEYLTEETKLFLQKKPVDKIPHEYIKELSKYILKAADNSIDVMLVGSYRRHKPTSRDIDVMLISEEEDALEIFMKKLSDILHKHSKSAGLFPYSKGKDKLSFILDTQGLTEEPLIVKLDIFRTNKEESIPMLLYSTGSKEFNLTMRSKAKKLGYKLNQRGLFKGDERVTGLKTELDYFKILSIDYLEPKDRI